MVFILFWLAFSPGIIPSRFIHVVACVKMSFLLKKLHNIPLCMHNAFCLSIYLLMDIWVISIFWLLQTASMSVGVQISLWVSTFSSFVYVYRNGIIGSNGDSVFNFFNQLCFEFIKSLWFFLVLAFYICIYFRVG